MTAFIKRFNTYFSTKLEKLKITIVASLILISCSYKDDIPKNIIQPKQMQSILWDNIKAGVYATEFIKKDSTKNDSIELLKMQKSILIHYHISEDLYKKSYQYYIQHPSKLTAILDSISANRDKFGFEKERDRRSIGIQVNNKE